MEVLKLQMLINGELCAKESVENFEVYSPFDRKLLAICPSATEQDCCNAVLAAERTYRNGVWRDKTVSERIDYLRCVLSALRDNIDYIVEIEARDIGILKSYAYDNVNEALINFENYLKLAENIEFEEVIKSNYNNENTSSILKYEPYGVCGLILPWNYPFDILVNKLVPLLLMGNCAVIKTSPLAPCSVLYFGEILKKTGFPPGVVNILSGGDEVGKVLVNSAKVRMISFTGSTEVGKSIYGSSANYFRKPVLECGGNSAHVVFHGVDIKKVAMSILISILSHAGQVCVAGRRVIVQDTAYDLLLKNLNARMKFIEYVQDINQEPKFFPVEPIISQEQLDKIDEQVKQAIAEGAKLVCGGSKAEEMVNGFYYKPTILTDVTENMTIFKEEVFGPVLTITKFNRECEAVDLVNESVYGLTAVIWTTDMEVGARVSEKIQAGSVYINTTPFESHNDNAPFGGYKMSGVGKEHGILGLKEFLQVKHILKKTSE